LPDDLFLIITKFGFQSKNAKERNIRFYLYKEIQQNAIDHVTGYRYGINQIENKYAKYDKKCPVEIPSRVFIYFGNIQNHNEQNTQLIRITESDFINNIIKQYPENKGK
jgi:hypothetical protein